MQKTWDRLEFEQLVELPDRNAKRDKYDGFILMSDDGLRSRTNVYYRIPELAMPACIGRRLRSTAPRSRGQPQHGSPTSRETSQVADRTNDTAHRIRNIFPRVDALVRT
jgi:hypothetical protein